MININPWSWRVVIASRWYPDLAYQNEPMVYYGRASTWEKCVEQVNLLTKDYPPMRVNIRWEPYSREE